MIVVVVVGVFEVSQFVVVVVVEVDVIGFVVGVSPDGDISFVLVV